MPGIHRGGPRALALVVAAPVPAPVDARANHVIDLVPASGGAGRQPAMASLRADLEAARQRRGEMAWHAAEALRLSDQWGLPGAAGCPGSRRQARCLSYAPGAALLLAGAVTCALAIAEDDSADRNLLAMGSALGFVVGMVLCLVGDAEQLRVVSYRRHMALAGDREEREALVRRQRVLECGIAERDMQLVRWQLAERLQARPNGEPQLALTLLRYAGSRPVARSAEPPSSPSAGFNRASAPRSRPPSPARRA